MTREKEAALDKFIEGVVLACQSSLVEEALKKQLFLIDDVINMYCLFDAKLQESSICVFCEAKTFFIDSETKECERCFKDNQKPQEIYEWWLVVPWFGRKLLLEGEPVLENDYGIWWGRCTTGQAISLDYVIEKIYHDIMG